MVLDIILPVLVELIADPIRNYVVTPIKRHVSYAFKSDRKVQELQEEVEQLQNKKDRLQRSVDVARRKGEEIFSNVTEWFSSAEKDVVEADQILQRKKDVKNKCFWGLCPNLKTRYQLSKNADKKAAEIQKLRETEGLNPISFSPPLQQTMVDQIMNALRTLNMIGVYNMGGIRKTTLAYEVQTKALQLKLFETVIVIHVSQTMQLRRTQREIADFLGLIFDAEEIPTQASQLQKRLENSKVLIILDDLWKRLDLVAVGIPPQKDCKIMLISRNMHLLSREMGAQKLFPLGALAEAETLSLFMSLAEPNDDLRDIATEIAKQCAGLRLLIQIVAAGLKNKSPHVWLASINIKSISTSADMI